MKYLDWLSNVANILPWLGLGLATLVVLIIALKFILRVLSWQHLLHRKTVFLELTPPSSVNRLAIANQELFTVIHGHRESRAWKHKLLRRDVVLAPEIVSAYDSGIRFIIQVEKHLVKSLQRDIHSHLPDVKVAVVNDYLPQHNENQQIRIYKQSHHFAFPLAAHDLLEQRDPTAYLAGVMTNMLPGEVMSIQYVITPVSLREARILHAKALNNEDLLMQLKHHRFRLMKWLIHGFNGMLLGLLEGVGSVTTMPTKTVYTAKQRDYHERSQVAKRLKPARMVAPPEQELLETVKNKLSQPLFRVSIRVLVISTDPDSVKERQGAIRSSLAAYDVPNYQSLKARMRWPFTKKYVDMLYRKRMPALNTKNDSVLSASEIASLYHFPLGPNVRTDNLATSLSPTLAAPLSLKNGTKLDVLLGVNKHHDTQTVIGLTTAERARHVYIIGGTGSGKTTMMQYGIIQDIRSGKGVAIIDPHGDLAKYILKYIPEERRNDVIYFNPDDLDHPIGLNLLEIKPGMTGNDLLRENSRVVETVVSVFRKLFSEEDIGGHRIEYILRNAVITAMTVPDATLFTVLELLEDADFRKGVIRKLRSKTLKDFWKNEFGQAGNMQRVKMASGVTTKLGRFEASPSSKFVLQQPKSTINFDDIMNTGKILICNFSKAIGEDTASLFGIATLALLQLAAYRREDTDQEDRKPFYIYVDEFQNFATTAFIEMLSESRKYKLYLTMAQQTTSQHKDKDMVGDILANAGTTVCFRTANPEDERVLLPLFKPQVKEGQILKLPAYNFYVSLGAILSQEPVSGETVLLEDKGSKAAAQEVIELSRKNYATDGMHNSEDSKPNTNDADESEDEDDAQDAGDAMPDQS